MKPGRDVMSRKVRIIVNDPFATDDSSTDEELELTIPPKVKRTVYEINLPCRFTENHQDRCDGVKTSRKKAPRQSKNPVGVRQRPSGKWAAEIQNPISRTKTWLGTFETPEESEKAYADKKVEYDASASSLPAVSLPVVSVNGLCLSSLPTASAPCVNADNLSLSDDVTASGESTKEVFSSFDFSDLQIPDMSFLAAEEESMVSGRNGVELDFDCLKHLADDFSLLDNDIKISGFENRVPSQLPDCHFTDAELEFGDLKFAFADQLAPPLNIACP